MSSLLVSPSAFDADRALTMDEARARFGERYVELRNKGRWYFQVKCGMNRHERDDAVANSMMLAWNYIRSLVKRGKCTDRTMTSVFYFACKHTVAGRRLHGTKRTHYLDVYDLAQQTRGDLFVQGRLSLEQFVSRCTSVPRAVQFKLDTGAWLATLTAEQQRRAADLADGWTTEECAERWGVSEPRVSQTRRWLERSFRKFMGGI
jgi:hypothetical protein